MSINDIQTELDTIKNNKEMPLSSSIGYILKKNVESMEEFMNNKVINMYARPWNKLEPKLKRTKLNEYLTILMDKKEINFDKFFNIISSSESKNNNHLPRAFFIPTFLAMPGPFAFFKK